MKRLRLSCNNARCCRDFSSREQQKPSLADILVVGKILEQAARNTASRWMLFQQETLSSSDLQNADEKLLDWLTDTFSGNNPHFRTDEAWNPEGLSRYLLEHFNSRLGDESGELPQSPRDVIQATMEMFLREIYDILQSQQNLEPSLMQYLTRWQMLLTGAPL